MDAGSIILTGVAREPILAAVRAAGAQFDEGWRPQVPAEYRVPDCSVRVSV